MQHVWACAKQKLLQMKNNYITLCYGYLMPPKAFYLLRYMLERERNTDYSVHPVTETTIHQCFLLLCTFILLLFSSNILYVSLTKNINWKSHIALLVKTYSLLVFYVISDSFLHLRCYLYGVCLSCLGYSLHLYKCGIKSSSP